MLKIVDVHLAARAGGEYIVLQNHGLTTISLRGWAVCTNAYLDHSAESAYRSMYVFREEICIKPYQRVVLFTGEGEDSWQPTTDGKSCYVCYWGKRDRVWMDAESVHLLHVACSRKVVMPEEAGMPTIA
jgi:hypothetical protein